MESEHSQSHGEENESQISSQDASERYSESSGDDNDVLSLDDGSDSELLTGKRAQGVKSERVKAQEEGESGLSKFQKRISNEWMEFRKTLPSFNFRTVILFPDSIFVIFITFLAAALITFFYIVNNYHVGLLPWDYRGELVAYSHLRTFENNGSIEQYFSVEMGWPMGISPICGLEVVSFTYYSVDETNSQVRLSAAAFIPTDNTTSRDIVAIFRDPFTMNADFLYVPSEAPLRSMEGMMYGANCFAAVVVDYAGFGADSGRRNGYFPYYMADGTRSSSSDAVLALIELMGEYNLEFSGSIYLSGYSMGGSTSLFAQRELDAIRAGIDGYSYINTMAVSVGSGFLSLSSQIDNFFKQNVTSAPLYYLYVLYAYNSRFSVAENDVFFSETLAANITDLFSETAALTNGTSAIANVNSFFPSQLSAALSLNISNYFEDLALNSTNVDEYGKQLWETMMELLEANDLSILLANGSANETMPVRINWCSLDEIVPRKYIDEFYGAVDRSTFMNITLDVAPPSVASTHADCQLYHLNETLHWFNALSWRGN